MTHTNGRDCRFLVLVRNAALPLCLTAGIAISALGQTKTFQGTVNIALANENGIVLLTDSAQSYRDATGWHHHQPVQKLFRLDDTTVCSIAGFAGETWNRPELNFRNIDVEGIIAEFTDELSKKPVPRLDAKLRAIGFLVGSYIDLVANRHEIEVGPGSPNSYEFEVIVAGYDADGKPKIKKLVLTPVISEASNGHRYWTHNVSPEDAIIEGKLAHLLGGIPNVSLQVLQNPEVFKTSPVIQKYAQSKRKDGGNSLTLSDLAALASKMAAKTARRPPFVGFVGGPDQIAILAEGRILKIKQPDFDDPPRTMKITLMVSVTLQGAGAAVMVVPGPNSHFVWIGSEIVGIKNPPLPLDGQFFYGSEIRDSIVVYHGGLLDFGPTNTVVNSTLFPYLPVGAAPGKTERWNGFDWNLEPPNTPSLPTMIGPRKPWGPFFTVPPTT
jgi:hypothetical protein